jgi:hypothetical protein
MLRLAGSPRERGAAQAFAAPDRIAPVPSAVAMRLRVAGASGHLSAPPVGFLEEQRRMSAAHVPEALEEIAGIADGFGLSAEDVFTYLHLGTLADLAHAFEPQTDGCSAWAVAAGPDGPLVVKNRDYRGEHLGLQRVFLHADPMWGGRQVLCVGSLGSPGAFSSGMNSDGFALVDTQVATTDHAPGVLRYFLMSRLLSQCASVPDALYLVAALPHAGGGTLVMADAAGAVGAVELGASRQIVDPGAGWVARTNHFTSPGLAHATIPEARPVSVGASGPRLDALRSALPRRQWAVRDAQELMAGHRGGGAFCRHGEDGDSRTISNVVFACADRMLHFSEGFPCSRARRVFALPH